MASKVDIHAAKHALRQWMGWHWGGSHTRNWHGLPRGILGIGFGVKRTKGKVAAQECLRVYVSNKLSVRKLAKKQRIPKKIEGYPTDIIPIAPFKLHQGPGGSISNSAGLTGSLACVVKNDSAEFLLGSWHVMTGAIGKDGDPIFMPTLRDDTEAPVAGILTATPIFHLNGGENAFDAAIAKIQDGVHVEAALDPGVFFGDCCAASSSATVRKRGCATQNTQGTIDGLSEDVPVMYDNTAAKSALLTGQILIAGDNGPFSDAGDSGALVCSDTMGPIAIIAGGSYIREDGGPSLSFASPIGPILDFYGVSVKGQ